MSDDLAFGSARLPVPASAADVTPQWLQAALGLRAAGMVAETLVATRIGEGYGLASQILRYRWHAGSRVPSVVVKLWDIETPAGTSEVLFYHTFGGNLSVRLPACFHAAVDHVTKRGVLILEDLDPVIQGDCLHQLPRAHAQALARYLARIHATWVAHPLLQRADWLRSLASWDYDGRWFAPRRTVFVERFGDRLDGFTRALLEHLEHAPPIANERLRGAAVTLLHADLHLDNVVFERDTEPVLLDWARCAKGPAALDLANLLFAISRLDDVEVVLATYLDAFAQCAGAALDARVLRHQLGAHSSDTSQPPRVGWPGGTRRPRVRRR